MSKGQYEYLLRFSTAPLNSLNKWEFYSENTRVFEERLTQEKVSEIFDDLCYHAKCPQFDRWGKLEVFELKPISFE